MQIIPSCSHTGTPLQFHSSTTSGSASLTKLWSRLSISPRSLILASVSCEGDWLSCDRLFFCPVFLFGPEFLIGGHRHRAGSTPSCGELSKYLKIVRRP